MAITATTENLKGAVLVTGTLTLPSATDSLQFNSEFPLIQNNLTVQILTSGLDSPINVNLQQANTIDLTSANPIEDVDEVAISKDLFNVNDFWEVSTFSGVYGWAVVDPLSATVGTITFVIMTNSTT